MIGSEVDRFGGVSRHNGQEVDTMDIRTEFGVEGVYSGGLRFGGRFSPLGAIELHGRWHNHTIDIHVGEFLAIGVHDSSVAYSPTLAKVRHHGTCVGRFADDEDAVVGNLGAVFEFSGRIHGVYGTNWSNSISRCTFLHGRACEFGVGFCSDVIDLFVFCADLKCAPLTDLHTESHEEVAIRLGIAIP